MSTLWCSRCNVLEYFKLDSFLGPRGRGGWNLAACPRPSPSFLVISGMNIPLSDSDCPTCMWERAHFHEYPYVSIQRLEADITDAAAYPLAAWIPQDRTLMWNINRLSWYYTLHLRGIAGMSRQTCGHVLFLSPAVSLLAASLDLLWVPEAKASPLTKGRNQLHFIYLLVLVAARQTNKQNQTDQSRGRAKQTGKVHWCSKMSVFIQQVLPPNSSIPWGSCRCPSGFKGLIPHMGHLLNVGSITVAQPKQPIFSGQWQLILSSVAWIGAQSPWVSSSSVLLSEGQQLDRMRGAAWFTKGRKWAVTIYIHLCLETLRRPWMSRFHYFDPPESICTPVPWSNSWSPCCLITVTHRYW